MASMSWSRQEEEETLRKFLEIAEDLLMLVVVAPGQQEAEASFVRGLAGGVKRPATVIVGRAEHAPHYNFSCDRLGAERTILVISPALLASLAAAAPDFMNRTHSCWFTAPPEAVGFST